MMRPHTLLLVLICYLIGQAAASGAERKPSEPLIVGHRGLLLHAPENTLSNFRACLELRLGFEFDVQRTKDGQLVCVHDVSVDRTTNGTGRIADLTLAQIRELDAGSWFDPRFADEKVPTVAEVLALVAKYKQRAVLIAVDLKAENVEAEVVQLAERHGVLDRLLFIGRTISEPRVRRAIREAAAKAQVAMVANGPDQLPAAISDTDADWVYLRYLPSKEEISAIRDVGKTSFISGPPMAGQRPENWRQAAALGIDAFLTDYPLELRTTLTPQRK